MEQKDVVKLCKDLGCCDGCCLRFLGLKNPNVYEDTAKSILKYQAEPIKNEEKALEYSNTVVHNSNTDPTLTSKENGSVTQADNISENVSADTAPSLAAVDEADDGAPLSKRRRIELCVTCLGILQRDTWDECFHKVTDNLKRKGYESSSFACALSAPISTMLREKAVSLRIKDKWPNHDENTLTPLKEAWKWSFGTALSHHMGLSLDSGASCPLLVTLTMDYEHDVEECEVFKALAPGLFAVRSQDARRFTVEHTRRSADQALKEATLDKLLNIPGWEAMPVVQGVVQCVSVRSQREPVHIAGRYVKLSRNLPQTPWVLHGNRVMESSVQEVIVQPLLEIYGIPATESESRVKFMSGGREDVDVRCLRDGRPFAVEIVDPPRLLTPSELRHACDVITRSQTVQVSMLTHITREQLTLLKMGEESKAKTYQALCVKLQRQGNKYIPAEVTPQDIERINSYTNTTVPCPRVCLTQRTPLRVLHRRPLIARTREILQMAATIIPDEKQVFSLTLRTTAGTYVKEWIHGELMRTTPSLGDALQGTGDGDLQEVLGFKADILSLDVLAVHLPWPPIADNAI